MNPSHPPENKPCIAICIYIYGQHIYICIYDGAMLATCIVHVGGGGAGGGGGGGGVSTKGRRSICQYPQHTLRYQIDPWAARQPTLNPEKLELMDKAAATYLTHPQSA